MKHHTLLISIVCSLCAFGVSGCLTQRTVTQNGEVKSQNYVVKRPLSKPR